MRLAGRRLLLISSIEHDRMPQSCDRARAEYYAARGAEFTLLFRPLNRSRRPLDLLRDTLSLRIAHADERGAAVWRIDPPFNYCAGFSAAANAATGAPGDGRIRRWLAPLGVVRELFAWPSFWAFALLRLRGTFDAAIGSGPYGGWVASALCRVRKARVFVYLDRDYEPDLIRPGLRQRLVARLEQTLIRRADVVVCVSRRLARLRRRQTRRQVVLLPNGVDFDQFAASRAQARRGHRLIYVGALFDHCGLDVAIDALPQIRAAHPDARLIVAGDGPEAARLAERARQRGVDGAVAFLGPQPYAALPDLLAQAEVGLANSRPSAFRRYACPLKLLDYMAAGLPSIATRGTEAGDIVQQQACGLATAHAASEFASVVQRLFADPALYARLRANAIAAAAEHTWTRLLAREAELIQDALLRGPAPSAPTAARIQEGT